MPCPDCERRAAAAGVAGGAGRRARHPRGHAACRRERAIEWFEELELTDTERQIARLVLREIDERLRFLDNVGVGYLSLDRAAATLSGGEAQRIRLATQIGSSLVGVLYILDEPSIGLHQRDNERLIATLERLRDLGNTVIVVEHDEGTMRAADHIVDIGPGAGEHGGHIVAQGTPEEVMASRGVGSPASTSRASARSRCRAKRRAPGGYIEIEGATPAQPEEDRRRRSRSACSAASPACRAPASPRSSTRSSTRRSRTGCTGRSCARARTGA